MSLVEFRKKIDALDEQLLLLLAQRLEICQKLADYKHENNLSIQDRDREQEVIKDRIKMFKELGFEDQKFVQGLFELIIKKSREVQQ